MVWAIAFAIGISASLLTTLCWIAIADRAAWRAAFYEAATIGVTIAAWQLWAARENDWRVLAAEGLGTVVGTWWAVRASRSRP